MRLQFHNPPLLIKFKTLFINPRKSHLQYTQIFLGHFGFSSSSSSSSFWGSWNSFCCSSSSKRGEIVVTTPMATANPKPTPKIIDDVVVGIAKKCWINYRKEATMSLFTPFVISLASGNLNLDTFSQYISQDIYFLKAFAQAYELAEDCADDDDAKLGIRELRKMVIEELKMHDSYAQEWGFDVSKETNLNPATVKYTEFLLATASGKVEGVKATGILATTPFEKTKVAAYTLGAMTPCMRLYAFLGTELLALLDSGESFHPYKKWISIYSSKAFQESAQKTEDLLDKLSVSLTGEELDIIEKLYHQAMKLEVDFFLAQPLEQKTVAPLSKELKETEDRLVMFSDFDLTFTVLDSSAILAEIAIVTAPKSDENQETQITRMSSAELRKAWEVLSRDYTEEYEQCVDNILHTEKADKFDYESLCKALEQLSNFEKNANVRVIESGVLKGLDIEDIKKAGEHMVLQDGCTNFFQSVLKNENLCVDIHVLSYCWCADLIRSSCSSGGLDALKIHANEFKYEYFLSTGEIVRKVESPIDKVEAFSKVLEDIGNDRRNLTVYIGDSPGDLLCLLKADIGIVIGSSPSLRRLGSHFGVSFIPLFPGLVEKQKGYAAAGETSSTWKGLSGILYTASNWAEIHAFFLGPHS